MGHWWKEEKVRLSELLLERTQPKDLPSAKQVDDALELINQDPNAGKINTNVDYMPVDDKSVTYEQLAPLLQQLLKKYKADLPKYQKAQKTGVDIIKKAMAQNKTERGETPDQDRKGFADRQARLSRVKDDPKQLMRALIGEFPRTTDKYHLFHMYPKQLPYLVSYVEFLLDRGKGKPPSMLHAMMTQTAKDQTDNTGQTLGLYNRLSADLRKLDTSKRDIVTRMMFGDSEHESKQKPYVSMSKGKDGKTQYSVLDKFGDTAYSTNNKTLAMAYLKKNYKDLNECDVHDNIDESHHAGLRAWFGKGKKGGAGGGGWDRYNSKGERIGKCGDRKPGEAKPKCLSKARAQSLRSKGGKKAIAQAVNRKRRQDSNPNRSGKAKNVSSKYKKKK